MTGLQLASAAKAKLRAELIASRASFVAGLNATERALLETGLAAQIEAHVTEGQWVAGYSPFGSEISPPRQLFAHAALLPRVVEPGAPLTFHDAGIVPLVVNRFGMAEPRAGLPSFEPDVVLVPLLGVDRRGYRIGYGGGYYDRTLAALRQSRRIVAIGCAWECQLVEMIPADHWDEPLDAIATPTSYVTICAR